MHRASRIASPHRVPVEAAMTAFATAVETAGLPTWPMARAEVIGEDDPEFDE